MVERADARNSTFDDAASRQLPPGSPNPTGTAQVFGYISVTAKIAMSELWDGLRADA
jgi:hypothetical protein